MMEIKFERIERPVLNGAAQRAACKAWRAVYDFLVIIDGEPRGTWHRNSHTRGYTLLDASGRTVRAPWLLTDGRRHNEDAPHSWHDVEVDRQAEFMDMVLRELDYIPTPNQIAARDLAEEEADRRQQAAEREAAHLKNVKDSGPRLLDVLTALLDEYKPNANNMIQTAPRRALWAAASEAVDFANRGKP
ncbi:MAG: hypothetical protein PHF20_01405 [Halothiobacillaceae bacterium]|nr:hypothetical protein [Halothiobacillaceae bacterium]